MAENWKQEASDFPPTVPVDDAVVALIRLPVGITPLHDIANVLDRHLGPGLVLRTDTGIQGWAVISHPSTAPADYDACAECGGWPTHAPACPLRADHPHSDPGDGRTECPTCGKWVWMVTHSCKGVRVA